MEHSRRKIANKQESLYKENRLTQMSTRELKLLLVLGYNCGLNKATLDLINSVIETKNKE